MLRADLADARKAWLESAASPDPRVNAVKDGFAELYQRIRGRGRTS